MIFTHDQMAQSIGRSRAAVSNLLRLLNLEDGVKKLLERGKLEMGHARALLSLEKSQQIEVANQVIKKSLSVRQTESLVKSLINNRQPSKHDKENADILRLQEELSDALGTSVQISDKKGKGKLIISYQNLDVLDGILERIR